MTAAAAREGGIRNMPSPRHPVSFRLRDDTKAAVERAAGRLRPPASATDFITEATEARLDQARCRSCHTAVPVTFGDLRGRSLDWWISEAVRLATGQRCTAHHPVTVGAAEGKPATARTEPPGAAPVVFLEPGGES